MSKEFIIRKDENSTWRNAQALWDYLKSLPEGRYKIAITKSDKRTLSQNNWIHAVIPQIRDALRDAGFDNIRTKEDAKAVVKALFFKKIYSNGIDEIPVVEGTSETTKIDFASRAEEIIKWGREYLGINIAPPGHEFEMFD